MRKEEFDVIEMSTLHQSDRRRLSAWTVMCVVFNFSSPHTIIHPFEEFAIESMAKIE